MSLPPPGPPGGPPPLPAHNPQLLEASISEANNFYRYDSQLSQQDREQLSKYFWQRLTIFPALGLPVVVGFIMLPNILKKRGILNPQKKHRLLQIGLGFFGLGVGFKFGGALATQLHASKLADNEASKQSYLALAKYPPQLGSKYYTLTSRYPELKFKNPDSIDWKLSPIFPVCLVLNKDVIQHFRNLKTAQQNQHFERINSVPPQNDEKTNKDNWPCTPENMPLTGTSWDNVVRRNKEQQDVKQKPLVQLPSTNSKTEELEEEQRKFDELLERERQNSMHDSFSDTEKKW